MSDTTPVPDSAPRFPAMATGRKNLAALIEPPKAGRLRGGGGAALTEMICAPESARAILNKGVAAQLRRMIETRIGFTEQMALVGLEMSPGFYNFRPRFPRIADAAPRA
ncbi:hypothetical protein [Caballeronia sp. LZ024]|uniref:hypothetical protein n=1 Tax=Caballeronia sp. LZ024 TaxID=3038561 RepID=UPI00285EECE3|nr:hypothetical protein [Caballeronia sp. LZ024]MDR5749752.1 hypothetical protein [Caballeronia sp. LZ024]